MVTEAAARKLAARRANERIKLVAASVNTVALGIVGAALVIPGIALPVSLADPARLAWASIALILHVAAHGVLGLLRSED